MICCIVASLTLPVLTCKMLDGRGNQLCVCDFQYHKFSCSYECTTVTFNIKIITYATMGLGFNIHIWCWVTDYLTDCYQTVVVNGVSSHPVPVISGVPQGSVLGPLLFYIYLTEISLTDGSKLTQ